MKATKKQVDEFVNRVFTDVSPELRLLTAEELGQQVLGLRIGGMPALSAAAFVGMAAIDVAVEFCCESLGYTDEQKDELLRRLKITFGDYKKELGK